MTRDLESQRLRRSEQKVDRLFWLCGVQTTALVLIMANYLLSRVPTLAIFLLVSLTVLFMFRRSLPRWARWCGQPVGMIFSGRVSDSTKPG